MSYDTVARHTRLFNMSKFTSKHPLINRDTRQKLRGRRNFVVDVECSPGVVSGVEQDKFRNGSLTFESVNERYEVDEDHLVINLMRGKL